VNLLLDTNVISEVRKKERCHPGVARWWAGVRLDEVYLSALVLGEMRHGIEQIRPRDPAQAQALERWFTAIAGGFRERILPVDQPVAEEWGRMNLLRTFPIIDGLIAATAKVHDLTLVTRDVDDLAGCGARLLNPFEPGPG
jgi:predicted nucleic acid-binding protein